MADLDLHLSAIIAGDADAFGRWIVGAEPELRLSLRAFAAVADCEAVLQETLLRVWQTAHRVTPDGRSNSLLRFAVRIARNLALSEARRFRTVRVDDEEGFQRLVDAAVGEPAVAPDPFLREVIGACREELPDKPAAALHARLQSCGAEPDELLAEHLGMRLNTFLQNFTRARKLLAECLERQGVELAMEWR